MPRFNMEFAVNGQTQTLTVTQRKAIRAGSKNYWYAVFSLDATVAELSPLYATFSREPYHRNRGRAIIVPLEQSDARSGAEYSCQIPWEVLTRKGSVFVGLFAGDMLVTNEVEVEVTEAAPTLGSEGHHTDPWYKPFVDALNRKQDKEAGKGLSTNDYTNEDKEKVAGIPANPKYTDTTYTAGDGINIDENNRISVDGVIGADYAPYIGINGNWYEWSDAEGDFVDTGVSAQGAEGDTFICTFGETTVEEIRAALTAKKAVGVKMENTPNYGDYGLVETAWLYSFETGTMPTYDAVNAFTFVCPTPWLGTVICLTASKTQNDETEWLEYTKTSDSAPTASSDNPVKSGGVYTALATKQDTSNLVTSLSSTSTDSQYPSAKCVYDAIQGAIIGAIEEAY